MEIFKLLGTVAIKNGDAIQAINDTASAGEHAQSRLSGAFEKIGSFAVSAGKVIASGLAVGTAAMAGLTGKALSLSGELEQNMGGSEAVFANYAKKMQDNAKGAYEKMGLSASNYLATANKMGALFKGAGFDEAEAADMSAEAMQRAADVASIMGISIESAMESIAGAAKGNFTMMDNLGVAINETNLEAYALSQGIEKAYTSMTQQEKIGLAMEMFLDKTAYATGNYAKENETLAGSIGTAKSALQNFLSGAGTVDGLVTALVNAGKVIVDKLNTIVPQLVEGIKQLISQLLPYLPGLIETLLPGIIEGAVSLMVGLISALPTILQILIEQLPFILTQIGAALVAVFPILLDTVKGLFSQIWDYISLELLNTGVSFEEASDKISEVFSGLWSVLQSLWNSVGKPIFDAVVSVVSTVFANISPIFDGIKTAFGVVWDYCLTWWGNVGQPIFDKIGEAVGIVKDIFAAVFPEVSRVFEEVIGVIQNVWESILKPVFDAIGNVLETYLMPTFSFVFEMIKIYILTAFEYIVSIWDGILKPLFDGICDFVSNVFAGNWAGAWEAIKETFANIFGGLVDVAKVPINGVIRLVNKMIEAINSVSIDVPDWVPGIGGETYGFSIPTIPELKKGGVLEKGQVGLLEGDGAEAVVPLENNQKWISRVSDDMQEQGIGGGSDTEIKDLLKAILAVLQDLKDKLPEDLVDAIASSLTFNVNDREFARLVKAVN